MTHKKNEQLARHTTLYSIPKLKYKQVKNKSKIKVK